MTSVTLDELKLDLSRYIRMAQRETVDIRDHGATVARLVPPYDEDDEVLMRWLEIPEVKKRFTESRERARQGDVIPEERALRELGLTQQEVSDEVAELDASESR